MNVVSRVTLACSIAVFAVGCSNSDKAAADSAAGASAAAATAAAAAPAPPPAFSLADAAGKWDVRSVPESGTDTTPTTYVMTATADTAGWMIDFPSGVKVPLQVMVMGDSVMTKTATFASQRRKNVKAMAESVLRMQGGKLVGTTVAHYMNAGADSVLRMRTEGTKKP